MATHGCSRVAACNFPVWQFVAIRLFHLQELLKWRKASEDGGDEGKAGEDEGAEDKADEDGEATDDNEEAQDDSDDGQDDGGDGEGERAMPSNVQTSAPWDHSPLSFSSMVYSQLGGPEQSGILGICGARFIWDKSMTQRYV